MQAVQTGRSQHGVRCHTMGFSDGRGDEEHARHRSRGIARELMTLCRDLAIYLGTANTIV